MSFTKDSMASKDNLGKVYDELYEEMKDLKNKYYQLLEQHTVLREQNLKNSKNLEEKDKLIEELKTSETQNQIIWNEKLKSFPGYEKRLGEMQVINRKFRDEIRTLEKRNKNLIDKTETCETKIQNLRKENYSLNKIVTSQLIEIKEMCFEYKNIVKTDLIKDSSLKKANKTIQDLEWALKEMKYGNAELQQHNTKQTNEIQNLKRKIDRQEADGTKKSMEIDKQKQKLNLLETELMGEKGCKTKTIDNKAMLETYVKRLEQTTKEKNQLQKVLERSRERVRELLREIKIEGKESSKLRFELRKIREENEQLKRGILYADRPTEKDLSLENDRLKKENFDLREIIDAIRHIEAGEKSEATKNSDQKTCSNLEINEKIISVLRVQNESLRIKLDNEVKKHGECSVKKTELHDDLVKAKKMLSDLKIQKKKPIEIDNKLTPGERVFYQDIAIQKVVYNELRDTKQKLDDVTNEYKAHTQECSNKLKESKLYWKNEVERIKRFNKHYENLEKDYKNIEHENKLLQEKYENLLSKLKHDTAVYSDKIYNTLEISKKDKLIIYDLKDTFNKTASKLNQLIEKSKEDRKEYDLQINIYKKSLADIENKLELANKKNKDLEILQKKYLEIQEELSQLKELYKKSEQENVFIDSRIKNLEIEKNAKFKQLKEDLETNDPTYTNMQKKNVIQQRHNKNLPHKLKMEDKKRSILDDMDEKSQKIMKLKIKNNDYIKKSRLFLKVYEKDNGKENMKKEMELACKRYTELCDTLKNLEEENELFESKLKKITEELNEDISINNKVQKLYSALQLCKQDKIYYMKDFHKRILEIASLKQLIQTVK